MGMAWTGVRYELVDVARRRVVVLVRGELHQGIQPGSAVEVAGIRGRCVGWDATWAELVLEADEGAWGAVPASAPVQLALDTRGFVRLRQGLERSDVLESPLKQALLEGPEPAEVTVRGRWPRLNPTQAAVADLAMAATSLGLILSLIHI